MCLRLPPAPHRGFDFTTIGSRGTPTDTPKKKSRLPRPRPRLRHCTPPSSLPQKPPCTSSCRKHQRDQSLQDGALKRGTTLKTTPPPDPAAGSRFSPEVLDPKDPAVRFPTTPPRRIAMPTDAVAAGCRPAPTRLSPGTATPMQQAEIGPYLHWTVHSPHNEHAIAVQGHQLSSP